jgi:hypothetical protein
MSVWHTETHPFLVRWSHPTGERLTRHVSTVQEFTTETDAMQALARPFDRNTSDAHLVKFERQGYAPMLAKRRRGKKVIILVKNGG